MYKITTLLLLISLNLFAQKAKNKGWYINEIHYPEISLPKDYKHYKINIIPNDNDIKLFINGEQKISTSKNPNISTSIHNLINLTGYSKSENPDFILEFTDLGLKHIISTIEKTNGYGENREKTYTGIVNIHSSIKLVVKDKKGNILFDEIFTQKQKSESTEVYNNASIKSNEIALSQIKKQYNANQAEYRISKNINIAEDVVRKISETLKLKFSSYYESKRVNLFLIKKEKKFGIQNNEQIEKLIALNEKPLKNYDEIAKESLNLFKSELKKIKNKNDKNQKKIYWSLLSNISGVYYALGNYEKAIEYAKMRESIDYNKKWKYNLEISQNRKEIVEENKGFDFIEATAIKAPKTIDIKRVGSYRNHTISALLEINTINRLTENTQLRDRALFYENLIFSTLITLKIPNYYKKSNKESAKALKEYQDIIKNLRAKNTHDTARKLFFKKYSYKTINKTIKKPNISHIVNTYKLTDYEITVFTSILEKYYMLIQAYAYKEETIISDYEKKNNQLKDNINKLILSRNFTQPIESEILLSLEYLNTQKSTKSINKKQIDNILYNLKTYCSSFSL